MAQTLTVTSVEPNYPKPLVQRLHFSLVSTKKGIRNSRQLIISQGSKCCGKILITQDIRGPEGIRSFKVNSNIQAVQETSGVNILADIKTLSTIIVKNFLVP